MRMYRDRDSRTHGVSGEAALFFWLGESGGRAHLSITPDNLWVHTNTTPKQKQHRLFTALLLRRKYLLWRCALACERLRCEPWRPWGFIHTA